MRIISGKNRGKKLISPPDGTVRPTSDRVKENIFNVLYNLVNLNGAKVLDLFCGSGGLGLEAYSRGAEAVFADNSSDSLSLAKKNASLIKADGCTFLLRDYKAALSDLCNMKFDVIFSDSPYNMQTQDIFESIKKSGLLEHAVLVIEHSAKNHLHMAEDNYIIDERIYGNTAVSFVYKRADQ